MKIFFIEFNTLQIVKLQLDPATLEVEVKYVQF